MHYANRLLCAHCGICEEVYGATAPSQTFNWLEYIKNVTLMALVVSEADFIHQMTNK